MKEEKDPEKPNPLKKKVIPIEGLIFHKSPPSFYLH